MFRLAMLLSPTLLVFAALSARAALDDQLIGYWQFDGGGKDQSARERDLVIVGGPDFGAGLFGQSIDLHGNAEQYAVRPVDDDEFNFRESDFTIQIWVNFSSNDISEQTLAEKFFNQTGPNWTLHMFRPSGVHFFARNGFTQLNNGASSMPAGVWNHVIVRREAELFELFENGVVTASTSSFEQLEPTTSPLLVGRRNHADGRGFPVDGRLDELAIWRRALSDAEIQSLYNGGEGRQVVPSVEGDTDGDGDVDLADLNNVRNHFGASGESTIGDTNGDDTVDLADLNNVRNYFGATAAAAVVPEPGTFGMAVLGLLCIPVLPNRRL